MTAECQCACTCGGATALQREMGRDFEWEQLVYKTSPLNLGVYKNISMITNDLGSCGHEDCCEIHDVFVVLKATVNDQERHYRIDGTVSSYSGLTWKTLYEVKPVIVTKTEWKRT